MGSWNFTFLSHPDQQWVEPQPFRVNGGQLGDLDFTLTWQSWGKTLSSLSRVIKSSLNRTFKQDPESHNTQNVQVSIDNDSSYQELGWSQMDWTMTISRCQHGCDRDVELSDNDFKAAIIYTWNQWKKIENFGKEREDIMKNQMKSLELKNTIMKY